MATEKTRLSSKKRVDAALLLSEKTLQIAPLWVPIISTYLFNYEHYDIIIRPEISDNLIFKDLKINAFYDALCKTYNHLGLKALLENQVLSAKRDMYYSISFPVKNTESGDSYVIHQQTKAIMDNDKPELKMECRITAAYYGYPFIIEGRLNNRVGLPMEKETNLLKKEMVAEIWKTESLPFTKRELDILELLHTHNSAIAATKLNISLLTMHTHCRNIVKKAKIISPYLETTKYISRYFLNLGFI